MAEISGLSLISAVAKNVRDAITTAELKAVYKDKPVQNVSKPYAFIHQIEAEHRPALKLRGDRFYTIDVRCHPEDTQSDINSWAYTLSEKISNSIERVYLLDGNKYPIKAKKISWRVEQNVLHVIATYSFKVTAVREEPDMNTILYGERVK